jgi:hypothetical protein
MITDLEETIKQLLTKKGAFDPTEVDISFESPNREWSASISKPTVNIYLYDIQENHQLRSTEWVIEKDDNGIATRRKNPSRIDLSYLITVWTNDVEDEHRLLWHVLLILFRYQDFPEELLSGQLAEQKYPIKTSAAQPEGMLKSPADLWVALDNSLKPSINYVVTLPLDLDRAFMAPTVKTKILEVKPPEADAERLVQVTGTVHKAGKPTQGIAQATVVAKEARMTAETDDQGRYSFPKLSEGEHTFQVLVSGKKVQEASVAIPGTSYDLEV